MDDQQGIKNVAPGWPEPTDAAPHRNNDRAGVRKLFIWLVYSIVMNLRYKKYKNGNQNNHIYRAALHAMASGLARAGSRTLVVTGRGQDQEKECAALNIGGAVEEIASYFLARA